MNTINAGLAQNKTSPQNGMIEQKRGLCNFPLAELGDDTVDGSEIRLTNWDV